MGTGSHNPNISVNVDLAALPPSETAFSTVLLLVPQATNSLDGDRVMTFASYADAVDANDAGFISAGTLEAARVAFNQPTVPPAFKVGRVNLSGGTETYATGLAACVEADADFYGVAITPRTDTEIVLVSDWIESNEATRRLLGVFQSDDSGLIGSFPSGLSGMQTNTRSALVYHTADAQWNDVAWLVNRLTFDPALVSAPWMCEVAEVEALDPRPTQAQRNTATNTNYVNLLLPYGTVATWNDPGTVITGRPVEEQVTADWLYTRIHATIAAMVAARSARGARVGVDATGQELVKSALSGVFQQAVDAGHLTGFTVTPQTITSDDLANRRLRFDARGTLAVSGRLFTFNVYLSR